jgi:opacity protein-like surface antigen
MKRTTTLTTCLVVALIACNAGAHDAPSGWLIGGSAVTAKLDREDNAIDDTSLGFKVFGQYKFNQWFGLEGSYYNSGDFESDATSAGGDRFELLYQGFALQGLGFVPLPLEGVEFFLKAGYHSFRVDSTLNGANTGDGSDSGVILGTGVSVHITEQMHFRTTVDWYDADLADMASIELGLEYRF